MEICAGHLSSKELFWSAAQRLKVSEQWLFMLIHCVLDHKWWLETMYISIFFTKEVVLDIFERFATEILRHLSKML